MISSHDFRHYIDMIAIYYILIFEKNKKWEYWFSQVCFLGTAFSTIKTYWSKEEKHKLSQALESTFFFLAFHMYSRMWSPLFFQLFKSIQIKAFDCIFFGKAEKLSFICQRVIILSHICSFTATKTWLSCSVCHSWWKSQKIPDIRDFFRWLCSKRHIH